MSARRLQIGFLTAALILTSLQCLFACAASADDRPAPPCHKHRHQCTHSPLAAVSQAPPGAHKSVAPMDTAWKIEMPTSMPASPGRPQGSMPGGTSPPGPPELQHSAVLKI